MANVLPALPDSPIEIIGDKPMVSSQRVAEYFGKRHDAVLRDIARLDCSEPFNLHNFVEIEYRDARGRKQRAYRITEAGFMFLAMGYTGPRAAAIKERFIWQFEAMREQLQRLRLEERGAEIDRLRIQLLRAANRELRWRRRQMREAGLEGKPRGAPAPSPQIPLPLPEAARC